MIIRAALSAVTLALAATTLARDEGMWLFTSPPRDVLKSKYGFEPTDAWLEHVRLSSVRFATGGSGSLVSADGLVMTNHHVGSDMISKLSTKEHNYLDDGYLAKDRSGELKCPDLEVHILTTIEDVTSKIREAEKGAADPVAARAAREAAIAAIEKASKDSTGMLSEVVTLFNGGQYHLYAYQRYTDVRLVFAPEQDVAFFGGDTDNFEFPRYDLDVSFFRIYENDAPLKPKHFLKFSADGAKAGDLALVSGHPGNTARLNTLDHLRYMRDVEVPGALRRMWRNEIKYQEFGGRNAENARIVRDDAFGVANGRKAYTGILAGLQDPALMGAKAESERRLREAVAKDPALKAAAGDAWDQISAAFKSARQWAPQATVLQRSPSGVLYSIGRDLVRLAEAETQPEGERFAEFRGSARESLELGLFSPAPIYDALEIMKIESGLAQLAEVLGGEHPIVLAALAGKSPRERAAEVVRGTSLKDIAARRELAAGGAAAIKTSTDPLIQLVNAIDGAARENRRRVEREIEAIERAAYAKIAQAKFAVEGDTVYPDATFTLRLAFGPIQGYTDGDAEVPPFTQIGGIFDRARDRAGQPGFTLPKSWYAAEKALDSKLPMNFLCAADIIGGNSGSPVVNTDGEVIGLIFDGNIHSLPGDFIYDGRLNRAVAVDSRAIIEALRKVYNAGKLADEIQGEGGRR